jgi:hypothetical protein
MLLGKPKVLEVHCWGGLGSQLFALALIHDLKIRFPSREYLLVLHSGVVTKRIPEISNIPFVGKFKVIDDFSSSNKSGDEPSLRIRVRVLLKKIAHTVGFVASANNDFEYDIIKPWVRQIRGHYSRRSISPDFLLEFQSYLDSRLGGISSFVSDISIHYRLGDLLDLSEKAPIDDLRLANEVIRVQKNFPGITSLFSDSSNTASELLAKHGVVFEISNAERSTLDVVNLARVSKYFVGTSSKISYWVICPRILKDTRIMASMPTSDEINLCPLIGQSSASQISYY